MPEPAASPHPQVPPCPSRLHARAQGTHLLVRSRPTDTRVSVPTLRASTPPKRPSRQLAHGFHLAELAAVGCAGSCPSLLHLQSPIVSRRVRKRRQKVAEGPCWSCPCVFKAYCAGKGCSRMALFDDGGRIGAGRAPHRPSCSSLGAWERSGKGGEKIEVET